MRYWEAYTHDDPETLERLPGLIERVQVARLSRLLGCIVYSVPTRRALLDFKVLYVPIGGRQLLEIGCGGGPPARTVEVRRHVHGIDPDAAAVRNSR